METKRRETERTSACLRRVLYRFGRTLAKKDSAYEQYGEKVTTQNTARMHSVYRDLYDVVGPAALELTCGRINRSKAIRRALVCMLIPSMLYVNYVPPLYSGFAIVVVSVALCALGTVMVRRRESQMLDIYQSYHGDLELFFADKNAYHILKKHKKSLPALAVSAHSGQAIVLEVLNEKNPAVVEILSTLSSEYEGTALGLLKTARHLA